MQRCRHREARPTCHQKRDTRLDSPEKSPGQGRRGNADTAHQIIHADCSSPEAGWRKIHDHCLPGRLADLPKPRDDERDNQRLKGMGGHHGKGKCGERHERGHHKGLSPDPVRQPCSRQITKNRRRHLYRHQSAVGRSRDADDIQRIDDQEDVNQSFAGTHQDVGQEQAAKGLGQVSPHRT
jgi:hypothetical protein